MSDADRTKRSWRRGPFAVGAAIAVLVGVTFAVGAALPVAHSAAVEAVVDAAPDEVWALISDPEAFPAWRSDVDRVELLPPREGRPVWREHGRNGSLTFAVERMEPPRLLVTRIVDEGLPFGGTWTYRLEPAQGSTRLTLTEDGEIYNPFFRFVARYVLGYEATLRAYMEALTARVEGASG